MRGRHNKRALHLASSPDSHLRSRGAARVRPPPRLPGPHPGVGGSAPRGPRARPATTPAAPPRLASPRRRALGRPVPGVCVCVCVLGGGDRAVLSPRRAPPRVAAATARVLTRPGGGRKPEPGVVAETPAAATPQTPPRSLAASSRSPGSGQASASGTKVATYFAFINSRHHSTNATQLRRRGAAGALPFPKPRAPATGAGGRTPKMSSAAGCASFALRVLLRLHPSGAVRRGRGGHSVPLPEPRGRR